uniref:Uncharacterized LOC100187305 n=1 Tax=Ciona intestinalis TaxID=7719 RepID=H2XKF3_CIOIN|nr:uncharacterized protein LOC100187305 [Ciona intestinalis]|eukprot:XP_002126996.1 uncharacterized protein LOC100187305 [Ciona intestinalis]
MTLATLPQTTKTPGSRGSRARHRRSATLPTRLPNIVPRSTLVTPAITGINPVQRIDVLHPPTVPKRTVFLETGESQYHMHRRCILMQQQKWMREHGEWQKPVYGTAAVRENYRSTLRGTLKSQMDDRVLLKRREWEEAVNESIMTSEKDRRDCMEDYEKRRNKFNFLLTFTKANKEMMETRWKEKQVLKLLENKRDSEQLKYNPINWSHTLK